MTQALIRKARLTDLDAVERIETSVFDSDQLSRASLRRYMSVPSAAMIVADENKDITGYALLGFRKGSRIGRLYSIAVDTARAGHGIGRALLSACEDQVRKRECDLLALEVRADNPRAIALYEKNGYVQTGEEPDWYEDGGTALRFEKSFSAKPKASASKA